MASLDYSKLERALIAEISQLKSATAPELCKLLGLSQPAFSRLVKRHASRLLVVGRARATRYAARRTVPDLGDRVPVYQVDEHARASRIATLHAVLPNAFYVEAESPSVDSRFHDDLPYWLNELRPAGFLGRLVPRQHPELELPSEVRLWTADQVLRYVARYGSNLSGNLILGDAAFQRYVASVGQPADSVQTRQRKQRYPILAQDVLKAGIPGSSAAGEQPKFLATKAPPACPVLVKFSPPLKSNIGRRVADLLVAEHLTLEVLTAHGKLASKSQLIVSSGQVFLEVQRFDRTPAGGRLGLISLLALDAEFVGRMLNWTDSVSRLAELDILPHSIVSDVAWLELFGRLIANTDMHAGNLSFFTSGTRVLALAPAYDMLPAQYAGRQGHLGFDTFQPAAPTPSDAKIWDGASRAALDLWRQTAKHDQISTEFRDIARRNADRVESFRAAARLLPAP